MAPFVDVSPCSTRTSVSQLFVAFDFAARDLSLPSAHFRGKLNQSEENWVNSWSFCCK
jgi:hypothetical protein